MSSSVELRQFEEEIRKLEDKMRAERQVVRRINHISLAVTGLLAAIIVTFFLINYLRIRSELTPEKISRSLEHELREISPSALRELSLLGGDVIPIYTAEFKKQLQAAWPDILAKVDEELTRLGDNVSARVQKHLAESEARVFAKTEATIFEQYPQLKDAAIQAELNRRLHIICDDAVGKTLLNFEKTFSRDVGRLQEAVFQFNVTDTAESTVDLQKKFLHLWLQLLDQEIMEL